MSKPLRQMLYKESDSSMHVELEPRMRARLGCELGDISSRCRNPPSQLLPSRAATKQILLMAYGCAGCRSLLTWLCLTKQCKLLSPCDTCIGNSRHCWVNVGHWVNRYVPTYSLHLANVTAAKGWCALEGAGTGDGLWIEHSLPFTSQASRSSRCLASSFSFMHTRCAALEFEPSGLLFVGTIFQFLQACRALGHLHASGVVHRDIKLGPQHAWLDRMDRSEGAQSTWLRRIPAVQMLSGRLLTGFVSRPS